MPLEHHLIPYLNYGPLSQHARGTTVYPWTQLALVSNALQDLRRQLTLIEHYMRRYGMLEGGRKYDCVCPPVEAHVEGGKYIATIPMGSDIDPDDLKISVKDHIMTVEAKREKKSKDGNTRVYQELTRKFTLPEKVQMKDVKSVLTPDGYLQIEAPHPIEIDDAKETMKELTSEDFVNVKAEDQPPDEVEIPVSVSSEETPSGCLNN